MAEVETPFEYELYGPAGMPATRIDVVVTCQGCGQKTRAALGSPDADHCWPCARCGKGWALHGPCVRVSQETP